MKGQVDPVREQAVAKPDVEQAVAKLKKEAMLYSKCDYWNDGSDDCDTCRTPMKGDCWNRMCLDLLERLEEVLDGGRGDAAGPGR